MLRPQVRHQYLSPPLASAPTQILLAANRGGKGGDGAGKRVGGERPGQDMSLSTLSGATDPPYWMHTCCVAQHTSRCCVAPHTPRHHPLHTSAATLNAHPTPNRPPHQAGSGLIRNFSLGRSAQGLTGCRRRWMRGSGDRVGGSLVVHFSKPRPDVCVYVLGLLRRRGQSCADSPHWLIRDDNLAHFLLGHSRKSLSHVQHAAHSKSNAQHPAHSNTAHEPSPLPLLTPTSYRVATAAKSPTHSSDYHQDEHHRVTHHAVGGVSTSQPHCVSSFVAASFAP